MTKTSKSYLVATDVGGTCTDTVVFAVGEPVILGKALSTPPDFATGVLDSIKSAADQMGISVSELLANTSLFVHGSTVVDNAILTRDGAKVGLLTTEGFEDTLLVTRGGYGRWAGLTEERMKNMVKTDRAAPLVERNLIYGVAERTDYKGSIIRDLDEASTRDSIKKLIAAGVDAIAISYLWSFYNQKNEIRTQELVKEINPDIYTSISSHIAPTPGEYERTSTTVINAYAGEIARQYIENLADLMKSNGYLGPVMIMQGYGGLLLASEAADRAIGMLECGPAAGVIGSKALGDLLKQKDVIATDMGGTTFKVSVIQGGQIEYAREPMIDRFHYTQPKIEVVSIGAGGGSIVWIEEETKIPRVGPRSAGSRPGPVCYGMGGEEPTLTDVFMLIGYMDPNIFLGGSMNLDKEAARRVFDAKIAKPLGLSVEEAAYGIFRIATAQITDLIREITVERGLDPRDFVMHAFGGSCGMVSATFGAELGVKKIVIPYTASVNCAFGLISADIVHEYSVVKTLPMPAPLNEFPPLFEPMKEKALKALAAEGFVGDKVILDWSVDLRYSKQVHEVTTPLKAPLPLTAEGLEILSRDFETLYERKYGKGSAFREAGIEMTQFRLTARGLLEHPDMSAAETVGEDSSAALIGRREIFVEAKSAMIESNIYDFTLLNPGNVVNGPAVIHTPITTIVVQANQNQLWTNTATLLSSWAEETKMDPITFSIIRHRLYRVVEEAVITLKHVSGSAITNEGHDLMVSLYEADGTLLLGGVGFLHHLTSAAEACKSIIRRFDGDVHEGDLFLLNDPFTAALHTSDIYLVSPIHYKGELIAWSACFVHVYDIGAMNPGGFAPDAVDVFSEGFSSPGLKLVDRGNLRQDVWDTLLNMVRGPEMVALDLRSMIACNNVAKDRMVALVEKYGLPTFQETCKSLVTQSESRLRERLRELPDGSWQSRQYFDVKGEVYKVLLKMTKKDDELTFDFTGSSPQSKYSVNCTKWASLGGLFAPLFPLLCYDITWNEGVIRPIKVIAPEGSIVNCTKPSPVSVATVGAIQSVNNAACTTIAKMLASHDKYEDQTSAVWHANHFAVFMFGKNQRGGDAIGILTETFAGAGGARTFADGVDIGGEIPNPISRMANVETVEAMFPVRYLFRRRLKDSGGGGEFRGGTGGEIALVPHDAPDGGMHYVLSGKGSKFPQSEGLNGGNPGALNDYVWVHSDDSKASHNCFSQSLSSIPGEKESISWGVFPLMGNDALYVRWNGGGGVGDSLDREPSAVLSDVINSLISPEAAKEIYGVVISNNLVDEAKTIELRNSLKSERVDAKASQK